MTENSTPAGFHLGDGHGYMLDRSYIAACRLNYQFYLWKESLQFNIHPSIPIPTHDASVADIGTGTAMWLLDLAREVPSSVQLDGLDISLAQAPPEKWLPANVMLRTWNALDKVPDDLIGKYDVVHARLICLAVEDSDPRPIMRNLIKMLKPGGYLQWEELDFQGNRVKTVDASLRAPALEEVVKTTHSQGRQDWILQLAETSSNEGLHSAELYRYEDRIELARANCEQHMLTVDEFAARLAKIGKNEEAEKLYRTLQDGYQECLQGAAISTPRLVCVARKPS